MIITNELFQQIQEQVNKVITHSQGYKELNTTPLLEKWVKNKELFINRFDGLVYEVPEPVTFRLGETAKRSRVEHFITTVASNYHNDALADFLELNIDGFYENKTVVDCVMGGELVVKAGAKLVKAFKFFESDPELLARIQTEASMLIQEEKIEGILGFSVHPLDYLSSSENNYNWRSCHSLDGEYRCGNLSYMCDDNTVICYLRGINEEKLPRFPEDVPWNSKKWRMLLNINLRQGFMFAGRQYPFFAEGALDFLKPYLHKALKSEDVFWSDWHNDYITAFNYSNGKDIDGTFKYVPIGPNIRFIGDFIEDGVNSKGQRLHFNDLLSSSVYKNPYYTWNKMKWTGPSDPMKITVGSAVPCVHCGQGEIQFTDDMLCEQCELEYGNSEDEDQIACCDGCGSRFLRQDGRYLVSGGIVCPNCASSICRPCAHCGNLSYTEDMQYSRRCSGDICLYCWQEETEE